MKHAYSLLPEIVPVQNGLWGEWRICIENSLYTDDYCGIPSSGRIALCTSMFGTCASPLCEPSKKGVVLLESTPNTWYFRVLKC